MEGFSGNHNIATVPARVNALCYRDAFGDLYCNVDCPCVQGQGFLRSIALLKNLPNIPNLAALMQRRVLCRHGLLINIGVPVALARL